MSRKLDNLHDLFEHELKDIYDAECRLVDALKQQAAETTDIAVRAAFQAHQKETEGQKERLETVFHLWGREPSRGDGCAGIQGLLEEHNKFKRENPTPEVLTIFDLTAAAKIERYEITAYESLIRIGSRIGLDAAVELFEQNVKEEEAALVLVTKFADEEERVKRVPVKATT